MAAATPKTVFVPAPRPDPECSPLSPMGGASCLKRNKVVVRVPATSANLGPGFDALGMAVDIWNEFTVERSEKWSLSAEGEGADRITTEVTDDGQSTHTVLSAVRTAFEYAGETPMPPVSIHCRNLVPITAGFGSSSAAVVGGLIAGLVLAGKQLKVRGDGTVDPEELLQLATKIEGHPDNVAPAIYGGIQLSVCFQAEDKAAQGSVMSRRVPMPAGLRLVAYVPTEEARFRGGAEKTELMRGLLKPDIKRTDAVFNIQRTALLVDSFHRGDLDGLRFAMRDRLHQPARGEAAYPHMEPVVQAALDAGAHGAFLSGAGPTVLCICSGASGDIFAQQASERQEVVVADAVRKAIEDLPKEHKEIWGGGKYYIVSPTYKGAHVISAEPAFSDGLATFGSLDGQL